MKRTYLSLSLIASALLIQSLHADYQQSTAEDYYQKARSLSSSDPDQAIVHYKQALAKDPHHVQAAFSLANILYSKKEWEQAVRYFNHVLSLRSGSPHIHFNIGMCLTQLNNPDEALTHFDRAIDLDPTYTKARLQKAATFSKLNNHDAAIATYENILCEDPLSFEAHYRLGEALKNNNNFDDAITHFRRAVDLQPKNMSAILQLANTLNMVDELEEALSLYQRVLDINPNITAALYNYGYTLKKMNKIKESLPIHDRVLELKPDYSLAQFSRSLSYLTLGDFERGWPEYESRWAAYNESPKKLPQPIWDGSDPHGKVLFLYAEQGLGDTYQFIRYAELVKKRGATVIVETQRPLKTILSRCPYIDQLIVTGDPAPECDAQIALMSLPLVFNTRVDSVPRNIPYLFADETLINVWREKLSSDTNIRVGLCWQGNANYRTQALRQAVAAKSMSAATFIPLAKLEGVSFYSLQKVNGADQLHDIQDKIYIHDFGPDFDKDHGRFMDTAAVMMNLDVVITVDTSIGHLAGGLGVPVWVMLPFPADWRWLLERNDTPWYPNMKLYRQPSHGDWDTVIDAVMNDLIALIERKKGIQNAKTTHRKSVPQALCDDISLEDIAYHATMLMINPNHTIDLCCDTQTLRTTYEHHYRNIPAFKELADQLLDTNRELWKLDTSINTQQHSLFDPQYMELLQKAARINNQKEYLLGQIKRLQS